MGAGSFFFFPSCAPVGAVGDGPAQRGRIAQKEMLGRTKYSPAREGSRGASPGALSQDIPQAAPCMLPLSLL